MAEKKIFQLPQYHYFKSGNGYSASKGEFRFKIFNQKDTLRADVWRGALCHEKSEILQSVEFPLDTDGYEALKNFIEEQYHRQTH